jgi:Icc protein
MVSETLLQFVHISDTHLLAPDQVKDFTNISPEFALYAEQVSSLPYHTYTAGERLACEINALPLALDFVLHTGDIAGESYADYAVLAKLFEQIRYPVIFVPGNHDRGADIRALTHCDAAMIWEYEMNGVQLVCLDSCEAEIDSGGWLHDVQLEQLNAICQSDDTRPLIVAVHHHPFPMGVKWLDDLQIGNGEALHRILLQARHRLRGVFHGHVHHSMDVLRDGILYSSVASAAYQFVGWPGHAQTSLDMNADPGFNIVTITRDSTFVRHHRYRIGST